MSTLIPHSTTGTTTTTTTTPTPNQTTPQSPPPPSQPYSSYPSHLIHRPTTESVTAHINSTFSKIVAQVDASDRREKEQQQQEEEARRRRREGGGGWKVVKGPTEPDAVYRASLPLVNTTSTAGREREMEVDLLGLGTGFAEDMGSPTPMSLVKAPPSAITNMNDGNNTRTTLAIENSSSSSASSASTISPSPFPDSHNFLAKHQQIKEKEKEQAAVKIKQLEKDRLADELLMFGGPVVQDSGGGWKVVKGPTRPDGEYAATLKKEKEEKRKEMGIGGGGSGIGTADGSQGREQPPMTPTTPATTFTSFPPTPNTVGFDLVNDDEEEQEEDEVETVNGVVARYGQIDQLQQLRQLQQRQAQQQPQPQQVQVQVARSVSASITGRPAPHSMATLEPPSSNYTPAVTQYATLLSQSLPPAIATPSHHRPQSLETINQIYGGNSNYAHNRAMYAASTCDPSEHVYSRGKATKKFKNPGAGTIWAMGGAFSDEVENEKRYKLTKSYTAALPNDPDLAERMLGSKKATSSVLDGGYASSGPYGRRPKGGGGYGGTPDTSSYGGGGGGGKGRSGYGGSTAGSSYGTGERQRDNGYGARASSSTSKAGTGAGTADEQRTPNAGQWNSANLPAQGQERPRSPMELDDWNAGPKEGGSSSTTTTNNSNNNNNDNNNVPPASKENDAWATVPDPTSQARHPPTVTAKKTQTWQSNDGWSTTYTLPTARPKVLPEPAPIAHMPGAIMVAALPTDINVVQQPTIVQNLIDEIVPVHVMSAIKEEDEEEDNQPRSSLRLHGFSGNNSFEEKLRHIKQVQLAAEQRSTTQELSEAQSEAGDPDVFDIRLQWAQEDARQVALRKLKELQETIPQLDGDSLIGDDDQEGDATPKAIPVSMRILPPVTEEEEEEVKRDLLVDDGEYDGAPPLLKQSDIHVSAGVDLTGKASAGLLDLLSSSAATATLAGTTQAQPLKQEETSQSFDLLVDDGPGWISTPAMIAAPLNGPVKIPDVLDDSLDMTSINANSKAPDNDVESSQEAGDLLGSSWNAADFGPDGLPAIGVDLSAKLSPSLETTEAASHIALEIVNNLLGDDDDADQTSVDKVEETGTAIPVSAAPTIDQGILESAEKETSANDGGTSAKGDPTPALSSRVESVATNAIAASPAMVEESAEDTRQVDAATPLGSSDIVSAGTKTKAIYVPPKRLSEEAPKVLTESPSALVRFSAGALGKARHDIPRKPSPTTISYKKAPERAGSGLQRWQKEIGIQTQKAWEGIAPINKSTSQGHYPNSKLHKLYKVEDVMAKLGGEKAGTIHLISYGAEIYRPRKWGDVPRPKSIEQATGITGNSTAVARVGGLARSTSTKEDKPAKRDPFENVFDEGSDSTDPFASLFFSAKKVEQTVKELQAKAETVGLPPSPPLSVVEFFEEQEDDTEDQITPQVDVGTVVALKPTTKISPSNSLIEIEGATSTPFAPLYNRTDRVKLKSILDAPILEGPLSLIKIETALSPPSSQSSRSRASPVSHLPSIPDTYPHTHHPHHTLISWIHVIPGAHPNFTESGGYELWFHTSSETISEDSRNVGRPIPVFGLEKGYISEGAQVAMVEKANNRFAGMRGGNANGKERNGWATASGRSSPVSSGGSGMAGGAADMHVAFMGWWSIKSFHMVEPESQELLEMLARKEENHNYDHAGRTIENWNKGLSHQKWIKARMEPYQLSNSRSTDPNLKSKKLVNPMEAVWKISVEEIPFIKAIPRKRNGRGEVVDVLGSPNEEGAEDEDNSMSLVTTSPEGQADHDQDGKERPVQKIKRFERMIGWERYVLDVVEEVRKGMGSVV